MIRKISIVFISLLLCAAATWANKFLMQVAKGKITIVQVEDDRNPFLYSAKVLSVQQKLNRVLSFNLAAWTNIEENGFWNSNTAAAIDKFREMYHLKYHLERFFAFSADSSPSLAGTEGLLDNELPNPANFAQEYASAIKMKVSDPYQYYGNSAQSEIRRIERALGGDSVNPITGELTKIVPLYQTPAQNDKILPLRISLRYSSQYSGSGALGTGWMLTEQAQLWFSYQNNEVVVQDDNGVSQKYRMVDGIFITNGNDTSGGYFTSIELIGEMGESGSLVRVRNKRGDILEFVCQAGDNQDSVASMKTEVQNFQNVLGYSVRPDMNSTNTIYGGTIQLMTAPIDKTTTNKLTYTTIECKNEFLSRIGGLVSDKSTNGWTVTVYADGKNHSFRRSRIGDTNVYAGYQMLTNRNRFGYAKVYEYDTNNLVQNVKLFAPSGREIDRAVFGYADKKMKSFSVSNLIGADFTVGTKTLDAISYTNPSGKLDYQFQYVSRQIENDGSIQGKLFENLTSMQTSLTNLSNYLLVLHHSNYYRTGSARVDVSNYWLEKKDIYTNQEFIDFMKTYNASQYNELVENIGKVSNQWLKAKGGDFIRYLYLLTEARNTLIGTVRYRYADVNPASYGYTNREVAYRLSGASYVNGASVGFTYVPGATTYVDTLGRPTVFNYPTEGDYDLRRVSGIVYPGGNSVSFTYNRRGDITWVRNELGYEFRYEFDEIGNILKKTIPMDSSRTLVWNYQYTDERAKGLGFPNNILQPDGSATEIEYNALGEMTRQTIVESNGVRHVTAEMEKTSNGNGYQYTQTSQYGDETVVKLDPDYNPSEKTFPDNGNWKQASDAFGKVTNEIRPDGSVTFARYDRTGNRISDGFSGRESNVYAYDALSRPVAVTNVLGGVTRTEYDRLGRKIKSILPDGNNIRYSYDTEGNLLEEIYTRENDYYKQYGYDGLGRMVRRTTVDPSSVVVETFGYDAAGNMTAIAAWNSNLNIFSVSNVKTYNRMGLVLTEMNALGGLSVGYAYDSMGRMLEESRTNGEDRLVRKVSFDGLGRVNGESVRKNDGDYHPVYSLSFDDAIHKQVKTDMDGAQTVLWLDFRGNVTNEETSALSNKNSVLVRESLRTGFDRMGNVSEILYPDGTRIEKAWTNGSWLVSETKRHAVGEVVVSRTFADFNGAGQPKTITDFAGKNWRKTYDLLARVVTETDPMNRTVTYTRDVFGNAVSTRAAGLSTTRKYNFFGKAYQVLHPDGVTENALYDALGNMTHSWKGNDAAEEVRYDFQNRPVWKQSPLGPGIALSYDTAGNLVSRTVTNRSTGDVITASFSYDWRNRPVAEYLPGATNFHGYRFDTNLFMTIETITNGARVEEHYRDPKGREIKRRILAGNYSNTSDMDFYRGSGIVSGRIFNSAGNIESEILPTGDVRRFVYDSAGQLAIETNEAGQVKRTVYDAAGRTVLVTNFDGTAVSNAYDDSGKILMQKQLADGGMTAYTYDSAGFIATKTLPDGTGVRYMVNSRGEVVSERNARGGETRTEYDLAGRVKSVTDPAGNSIDYTYDSAGRLKTLSRPGNRDGRRFATSVDYDGLGRTNSVDDGLLRVSFTYDAAGRTVSTVSGGVRTNALTYTPEGYLLTERGPSGIITSNSYDSAGYVTSVRILSTNFQTLRTVSNIYDATGRAIWRNDGSGIETFVSYDALSRVLTNRTQPVGHPELSRKAISVYRSTNDGATAVQVVTRWTQTTGKAAAWTRSLLDFRGNELKNWISNAGYVPILKQNAYDSMGRVTNSRIYPDGDTTAETVYSYENGQLASVRDPAGLLTRYDYDTSGRMTAKIENGVVTSYDYHPSGKIFSVNAAGMSLETWLYDASGRTIETTNATAGLAESTFYSPFGEVLTNRKVDLRTLLTVQSIRTYDTAGRTATEVSPLGAVTSYTYDALGRPTSTTLGVGDDDTQGGVSAAGTTDGLEAASLYRFTTNVYDGKGNLLTNIVMAKQGGATKSATNVVTYGLWNERLSETVVGIGSTVTAYDSFGRAELVTDRLNEAMRSLYDAYGRVTNAVGTNAGGYIRRSSAYNRAGRTTDERIYSGGEFSLAAAASLTSEISNDYDPAGNLERKIVNPGVKAVSESYEYDVFGRKIAENDAEGRTTRTEYDALSRVRSVTDPLGRTVTVGYSEDGRKTTSTRGGISESVIKDGFGNTLSVIDGLGHSTTNVYNALGLPTGRTDRENHTTTTIYDILGRALSETRPDLTFTSNTYDGFGNILTVRDRMGTKLTRDYDAHGRILSSIDALSNTNAFFYGTVSHPNIPGLLLDRVTATNALGNTVTEYKNGDALYYHSDELNQVTTYAYDSLGRIRAVTDPRGNAQRKEYDVMGRVSAEVTALGLRKEYLYSPSGRLISTRTPDTSISSSYNEAGELISTLGGTVKKTFTYDARGRVATATEGDISYAYLYNSADLVTNRREDKTGVNLAWSYDNEGRKTSTVLKEPGKTVKTTFWTLDPSGNILSETAMTGPSTGSGTVTTNLRVTFLYDAADRVTNKTYSTGIAVRYGYDILHRLTAISNLSIGTSTNLISILAYGYNRVGNRTNEAETTFGTNGMRSRLSSFQYDAAGRLTASDMGDGYAESYTYNAGGSRTSKTVTNVTTSYLYDADCKLITERAPSGITLWRYDRAGRLIQKQADAKTEEFRYNDFDRMTEYRLLTNGVWQSTRYTTDPEGMRTGVQGRDVDVWGDETNVNERSVYDSGRLLSDGSGYYLGGYSVNSLEGRVDAFRVTVMAKDCLGSVRFELYSVPLPLPSKPGVKPASISVRAWSYTAWGEVRKGDTSGAPRIGFTGYQTDQESGLYYAINRYYISSAAVFNSRDPVTAEELAWSPAGINRYWYCNDNPTGLVDPTGESPIFELTATGLNIGINFWEIGIPIGFGMSLGWGSDISVGAFTEVGTNMASLRAGVSYGILNGGATAYASVNVMGNEMGRVYATYNTGYGLDSASHAQQGFTTYGVSASFGTGFFSIGASQTYDIDGQWYSSTAGASIFVPVPFVPGLSVEAGVNFNWDREHNGYRGGDASLGIAYSPMGSNFGLYAGGKIKWDKDWKYKGVDITVGVGYFAGNTGFYLGGTYSMDDKGAYDGFSVNFSAGYNFNVDGGSHFVTAGLTYSQTREGVGHLGLDPGKLSMMYGAYASQQNYIYRQQQVTAFRNSLVAFREHQEALWAAQDMVSTDGTLIAGARMGGLPHGLAGALGGSLNSQDYTLTDRLFHRIYSEVGQIDDGDFQKVSIWKQLNRLVSLGKYEEANQLTNQYIAYRFSQEAAEDQMDQRVVKRNFSQLAPERMKAQLMDAAYMIGSGVVDSLYGAFVPGYDEAMSGSIVATGKDIHGTQYSIAERVGTGALGVLPIMSAGMMRTSKGAARLVETVLGRSGGETLGMTKKDLLNKITYNGTYSGYSARELGRVFKSEGGVINFINEAAGKYGEFLYDGTTPVINLYKGANKSTFLHEYLHYRQSLFKGVTDEPSYRNWVGGGSHGIEMEVRQFLIDMMDTKRYIR